MKYLLPIFLMLLVGCATHRPVSEAYTIPFLTVIVAEPEYIRATFRGKVPKDTHVRGYYDSSTRTMFVPYNSFYGTQPDLEVMGHELGHAIAGQRWYK
jgi:hypothetical protein